MADPSSQKPHNDAPTHDRVNRPPHTFLASRFPLLSSMLSRSEHRSVDAGEDRGADVVRKVHRSDTAARWRPRTRCMGGRFDDLERPARVVRPWAVRPGCDRLDSKRRRPCRGGPVLFDRAIAVPRLRPGRYSTAIGFRGACPSIIRNRWGCGMLEAMSGRMRIWTEQRVHCRPSPESSGSCSGERRMPLPRDRWRRRLLLTNSLREPLRGR